MLSTSAAKMQNLVTEFNGKLSQPLQSGQYFAIDVQTIENPQSFHIALTRRKLNEFPDDDIDIYIKMDFGNDKIIDSKRNNNNWSYGSSAKADIKQGAIKLNIYIGDNSCHVSANGSHVQRFYHQTRLDQLQAIQIGGDLKLITRMDHRQIYPTVWPPNFRSFGLSFTNDIPIRLRPGHLIVITGRCFGQPTGQLGFNIKDAHSAAQMLHVTPRFNSSVVVRNSLVLQADGSFRYGPEESQGGFPFDFNKTFRLGIGCKRDEFVIALNGLFFCTYTYRTSLQNLADMVGIEIVRANGTDVKITEIDHIQMPDENCSNIEQYTKVPCSCSKK